MFFSFDYVLFFPRFVSVGFYRTKQLYICYRGLGIVILSVRISVRLSLTRVLCDETKEHTAVILTPHARALNLVF